MCARDATGPTTVSLRSSRASDYAEARCREPARFPASGHELGIIRDPALWRLCRARHKRHSFAMHTLLAWYHTGVDVEARLPWLSTYLGHVGPSTYWYLTATPELVTVGRQSEHRRRLPGCLPPPVTL